MQARTTSPLKVFHIHPHPKFRIQSESQPSPKPLTIHRAPPVARLPNEVLLLIFEAVLAAARCRISNSSQNIPRGTIRFGDLDGDSDVEAGAYDEDSDGTPIRVRATYRPEVVLSHVSSRWRALAVSAPSLWTHIHVIISLKVYSKAFNADNADSNGGERTLARVETYLRRSGSMPLGVAIRAAHLRIQNYAHAYRPGYDHHLYTHTNRPAHTHGWHAIIAALRLSAHRICQLDIADLDVPMDEVLGLLCSRGHPRACPSPYLNSYASRRAPATAFDSTLTSAPRYRALAKSFESDRVGSAVGFRSLTVLTLDNHSGSPLNVRPILEASPNLGALTIIGPVYLRDNENGNEDVISRTWLDAMDVTHIPTPAPKQVQLPSLHTLTLHGVPTSSIDIQAFSLLSSLCAPKLRRLELWYLRIGVDMRGLFVGGGDSDNDESRNRNLAPRFPNVQTLVIHSTSVPPPIAGIHALARAFPGVKKLTLGGSVIRDFGEAFTLGGGDALNDYGDFNSDDNWPHLERLVLVNLANGCLLPIYRWLEVCTSTRARCRPVSLSRILGARRSTADVCGRGVVGLTRGCGGAGLT
ncbi:hypothetical protein BJ138DRAFT_1113034 [Hygrophoropsis aurantiaca]|uniref:Uncharacterized protein n=1 Tax=Hygrophoropsis aurantiaca TaxID=72124 RepID=A0ACB8AEB4_9AGAM|nr:hypothetical protein BJ138DRAFT_1113034 [Hygrophoropsis aurantiaca]